MGTMLHKRMLLATARTLAIATNPTAAQIADVIVALSSVINDATGEGIVLVPMPREAAAINCKKDLTNL